MHPLYRSLFYFHGFEEILIVNGSITVISQNALVVVFVFHLKVR